MLPVPERFMYQGIYYGSITTVLTESNTADHKIQIKSHAPVKKIMILKYSKFLSYASRNTVPI